MKIFRSSFSGHLCHNRKQNCLSAASFLFSIMFGGNGLRIRTSYMLEFGAGVFLFWAYCLEMFAKEPFDTLIP